MTGPATRIQPQRPTRTARGAARFVVAAMLLLGACGAETAADLTDDELREALYDTFTEGDAALDDQTATCLIDYLFDNTSRAELNRLSDAEVDDLTEDDIVFIQDGLLGCQ